MDITKYLLEQIKKCRFKMNLAKVIDCGVMAAAAAGVGGIFCELISFFIPFYYVHLAAGLCFGIGVLAGAGYGIWRRADMKQAAGRLDSFGLKERMVTAYEQIEIERKRNQKDGTQTQDFSAEHSMRKEGDGENEFIYRQREDAFGHYEQIRKRIKISLAPDKRHVLALALSAAAVIGMALLPSPVRDEAQLLHQVHEQSGEAKETLEELLDALDSVDLEHLTEEQKAQLKDLQDALKLSQEELERANSWESLASALEKLDYKYEQAGQSLENLASQMTNPEAAGIAGAEALAKAAANQNGQQMASAGAAVSNQTPGGEKDGNGDGDGSGSGSGDGDGSGSGSGDGDGSGSGSGDGDGSGSGDGDGSGSGRGTGSGTKVHDYVSVPNAIGDDDALTGNKNGDQESDYYRQQNGLAWEGEHVDYNSVIGQYTDNAYEGITNNRYPSGMESVIRDYFENLNK